MLWGVLVLAGCWSRSYGGSCCLSSDTRPIPGRGGEGYTVLSPVAPNVARLQRCYMWQRKMCVVNADESLRNFSSRVDFINFPHYFVMQILFEIYNTSMKTPCCSE